MQAIEHRRGETLDLLASHYVAGHVREDTLEHRVEQAMRASSPAALRDVFWDLPPLGRSLWRVLTERFEREAATRLAFLAPSPVSLEAGAEPVTYLIGRSRACDLVLADPAISRRHALVSFRGDRCTIRNLASMNGTQVNGRPVRTAVLHPGDEVWLGGAVQALVR